MIFTCGISITCRRDFHSGEVGNISLLSCKRSVTSTVRDECSVATTVVQQFIEVMLSSMGEVLLKKLKLNSHRHAVNLRLASKYHV